MSQIASAAGSASPLAGNSSISRFSEMNSEDFIKIIFTELTNQDPLQPNDTGALLDQLSSIRSIESDIKVTDQLKSLVTENQLASASNMLGKLVTGLDADLNQVSGFAVSARKEGDVITLDLDTGASVPMDSVQSVIDPAFLAPAPADGSAG